MKKTILMALLIAQSFAFSQEEKKPAVNENQLGNISAIVSVTDALSYGFSSEQPSKFYKGQAIIFNAMISNYSVTNGIEDVTGKGNITELGQRFYFNKKINSKFYAESLLSYSKIKFKDDSYRGVYEYFSPVNVSAGYKFLIGKYFVIEPSLGFLWKIEIKARGDVDNKIFDNTSIKTGLRIGYSF